MNDERSILDGINKLLFSLFAFPDIFYTACVYTLACSKLKFSCYSEIIKVLYKEHTRPVVQSVARPIADPGLVSLILTWSHTFVETGHKIFFMVILHLPQTKEGLVSFTRESMCMK